MCQSKAKGGRRCQASLIGLSNYPDVIKYDTKNDSLIINQEKLLEKGQYAMHIPTLLSRANKKFSDLPEEIQTALRNNHTQWANMSDSERWQSWSDISLLEHPSRALETLYEMGWEDNFPELKDIRDVPQSPFWHPEGAVHVHIAEAADVAAKNALRDNLDSKETQLAVLGAISHDFGKSVDTVIDSAGNVTSSGHALSGKGISATFLERIGATKYLQQRIPRIVQEHMCHANDNVSDKAVRGLIKRLSEDNVTFEQWARIAEADVGGRGTASTSGISQVWLDRKVKAITIKNQKSLTTELLNGKVLKEAGIPQGAVYSQILRAFNEDLKTNKINTNSERDSWLKDYVNTHKITNSLP